MRSQTQNSPSHELSNELSHATTAQSLAKRAAPQDKRVLDVPKRVSKLAVCWDLFKNTLIAKHNTCENLGHALPNEPGMRTRLWRGSAVGCERSQY